MATNQARCKLTPSFEICFLSVGLLLSSTSLRPQACMGGAQRLGPWDFVSMYLFLVWTSLCTFGSILLSIHPLIHPPTHASTHSGILLSIHPPTHPPNTPSIQAASQSARQGMRQLDRHRQTDKRIDRDSHYCHLQITVRIRQTNWRKSPTLGCRL